MRKLLVLLLTLCLALPPALAETISTPTDTEPTAAPTQVPTETPTPEPTPEPTLEPTAVPTEAPTEAPTAEPTAAPTAAPTDAPTQAPTATPILSTPADGPLYVLIDGVKLYGQPEELLPLGLVMYLYDDTVIELTGFTEKEIADARFALDRQVFTADNDVVYLAQQGPNGETKKDTYFLWAGKKADEPTPTPMPTAAPTTAPTAAPTAVPTAAPTAVPTAQPTSVPTAVPSAEPSAAPQRPSFSFSGSRSGSSRSTSHAASSVEDVVAYGGVALTLTEEGMSQLTLGGATLDLTLNSADPAHAPTFTAQLADLDQDGIPDALLLTADAEDECTWRFSGKVCKTLETSGVTHLLLCAGDQTAALPAQGFTGGLRYGMLRAQGKVSKDFHYSLSMDGQGMTMTVTVNETEYPMGESQRDAFCMQGVLFGTADEVLSALSPEEK